MKPEIEQAIKWVRDKLSGFCPIEVARLLVDEVKRLEAEARDRQNLIEELSPDLVAMQTLFKEQYDRAERLEGMAMGIINEIDTDERYHYASANIAINAPLALIQMGMHGRMDAACTILDIPFKPSRKGQPLPSPPKEDTDE